MHEIATCWILPIQFSIVKQSIYKRKTILFRVITLAKLEYDNVLQPEPRSGKSCNTFSHEGLANIDTEKNVIYSHCYMYIPSFSTHNA